MSGKREELATVSVASSEAEVRPITKGGIEGRMGEHAFRNASEWGVSLYSILAGPSRLIVIFPDRNLDCSSERGADFESGGRSRTAFEKEGAGGLFSGCVLG
jgi:hypothetical protein